MRSGVLKIVGSFQHGDQGSARKGGLFSGLITTVLGIRLIFPPIFFCELIVRLLGIAAIYLAILLLLLALKFLKVRNRISSCS